MGIDRVLSTEAFDKDVKGIRDASVIERIEKQVMKIIERPCSGKPLRYGMKNERTVYIKPYRLIYSVDGESLILLRFEHRKSVYRK